MNGINKIFIAGNLGTKPELYTSKKGKPFTTLSIATHRSIKNDDGTWKTQPTWHRVMVWGRNAETCAQRLTTGSAVLIEGHMHHYQAINQDGEPEWRQSITADAVEFFGRQAQNQAIEDSSSDAIIN